MHWIKNFWIVLNDKIIGKGAKGNKYHLFRAYLIILTQDQPILSRMGAVFHYMHFAGGCLTPLSQNEPFLTELKYLFTYWLYYRVVNKSENIDEYIRWYTDITVQYVIK